MAKICILCRKDISNAPRTKDAQGNYYCQPCADAARRRAATSEHGTLPAERQFDQALAALESGAATDDNVAANRPTMASIINQTERDPSPEVIAMAFRDIRADEGPFTELSNSFQLFGTTYAGPAFVSPIALYLVKESTQIRSAGTDGGIASVGTGGALAIGVGALAGGFIGAAVAGAIVYGASQPKNTHAALGLCTCQVFQLSPATCAAVDPRRKKPHLEVVVINRKTLTSIELAPKGLSFSVGSERFVVQTGAATNSALLVLRELNWQTGSGLKPSMPPAHFIRPDLRPR